MINVTRTDAADKDFSLLAKALEQELAVRDGENQELYAELNKVDFLQHAVVAYHNKEAAGCGACREYEPGIMEIKRMFVKMEKRKLGIASIVLDELENWCRELGIEKCVLETGKNQPEAIAFYQKHDYIRIPNFGKYTDSENSVCFEKRLNSGS